ncbi:hypothetical protein JW877_00295, partial [bacterium]|nr:hypothetical protein [bacterium]
MKKVGLFCLMLIVFCFSAEAIPNQMFYQGKVTDTLGVGITDTLPITFSLYSDSVGGTLLWTENQADIVIFKGLFDVILGKTNPILLPFDSLYYLEIIVDSDTLSPRQELYTQAYAFRAKYADSAAYADTAFSALFADSVLYLPDTISINQLFVNWIDPLDSPYVNFSAPIKVPEYIQTHQIYANMIDPVPGSGISVVNFSAPIFVPGRIRTDTLYSHQIFADWIDPLIGDTIFFSGPIWAPNWPAGGAIADSDWARNGNYLFTFFNTDSVGIGT